jgi:hypothetical protein
MLFYNYYGVDGVGVNVGGGEPSWGDVNVGIVDCGGICCCWESGCCSSCCCRKAHWGDCAPM